MASAKILEAKKGIVKEIENSINDSESVVLFQYQGLLCSFHFLLVDITVI